ncbi:uncharacterized protein METZ01_LOCUS471052, partial [marine metagenome]
MGLTLLSPRLNRCRVSRGICEFKD